MAVMELTTNAKTTTTTTKPKLFNEIEENMADTIPYIHVTWFELVAQLSPPPPISMAEDVAKWQQKQQHGQ